MEKKFELLERVRKNLEQSTEEAKKALKGKDKEVQDLKDRLRQAKEVAIREYRDSDAMLSELGDSFLQGFDNTFRQVKKAYPDLDVSNIKVEDQAQTFVMPVTSKDTNDFFVEDATQGDRESTLAQNAQGQVQIMAYNTCQEKDADPQEQIYLSVYLFIFFVSWENNPLILSVVMFMLNNFPFKGFIFLSAHFGLIARFMVAMNVMVHFSFDPSTM